jgi:hypothetical protein
VCFFAGVGASKSAGVVGQWGSASFTSIRSTSAAAAVLTGPGPGSADAVLIPKKFFKSKSGLDGFESNDFEPIEKPVVVKPVKPTSRFFKSKGGAPQPLKLVKPLRPLEVTPNQQLLANPQKVPQFKVFNSGSLGIPVKPDSPKEAASKDEDEDLEISFKNPSLVVTPTSRSNNSSVELSPNMNNSPVKITSPTRNKVPPVPVRAFSPPSESLCWSPQGVQRTTRVSRMVEPVKLVVENNDIKPAFSSSRTSSYGNGAPPQPRSYTRRQPLKRTEEPVQPSFEPAAPVNKKIKEDSAAAAPTKVVDYSVPTQGVQETLSSDVVLTRLSTKSASIATDMNVASEIIAPAGAASFKPKKSIFKSKSLQIGAGQKKTGLSLYKHKFGSSQDDKDDEFRAKVFHQAVTVGIKSSLDFDGPSPSPDMSFSANKFTPMISEDLEDTTTIKCPKTQRNFFTVIKNVKKAHQIQDSGEFQEFNDDVEYIMDGLGKHNNLSTRCLSTITLASKCMEPPFRMHLRAHGTMNKFFAELCDAPKNPSLALCTATVLFVLSQDRLNMDMDRDSLELMLNLLDTDSRIKDALDGSGMNKKELEKNKQKVQDLCSAMMKAKGHATTNLSIEHISAGKNKIQN